MKYTVKWKKIESKTVEADSYEAARDAWYASDTADGDELLEIAVIEEVALVAEDNG